MNKLLPQCALLASIALAPLCAQADWTLIDDFEANSPSNPPVYPVATNGGSGLIDIIQDVPGAGGSMAAHFSYGEVLGFAGDVWFQLDLPEDIDIDETGTIFFRLWQSTHNISYLTIASKTAAGEAPNDTALWSSFSALFRFSGSEPFKFDAHTGGYTATDPIVTPALQEWYNVWMVLDNSYDSADAQTGGYQIYIQGPSDSEPQLVTFGSSQASDLIFRNKAKASIKTFVLANNASVATDGVYLIDDIYMTKGICTENPTTGGSCDTGGEMWGSYAVVVVEGQRWVDTGEWLGWLLIDGIDASTGAGWAHSSTLGTWLYMPSVPGDNGSWVYALK